MTSRTQDGGRRSRPRSILRRIAWGAVLGPGLLAFVALVLLPWLGRQGDLNRIVEGAFQSVLSVPVTIASVETDPLSDFAITRVSSVSSGLQDRFQFRCDRIAVFYRPLDLLLENHLGELIAEGPSLFLNLDKDLAGILAGGGGQPRSGSGTGSAAYKVDRFRIADGRLSLRLRGRDLVIEDLELDASGIGSGGPQDLTLQGRILGARLTMRCRILAISPPPGSSPRWKILSAKGELEDLDVGRILPLLAPGDPKGEGALSFSVLFEGIWPDRLEARISARLRESRVEFPGGPSFQGTGGNLEIDATALGGLARVDFHALLEAEGAVETGGSGPGPGRPFRESLALDSRGTFEAGEEGGSGPRVKIDEGTLRIPLLRELKIRGSAGWESGEPTFSFDLEGAELKLEELGGHALGAPVAEVLGASRGTLGLSIHASGAPSRPEILARFDLEGFELGPRETPRLRASLAGTLGLLGRIGFPQNAGRGPPGPERLDGEIQIARGSLSAPEAELEAPSFKGKGKVRLASEPLSGLGLELAVRLEAEEIGIGPIVEASGGAPFEVEGRVGFQGGHGPAAVRLDLRVGTPSTGPVAVAGTLEPGENGPSSFDLEIEARSIPASRFLRTYIADPFREKIPALKESHLDGALSLEGRLSGSRERISISGDLRGRDLMGKLAGAELEGLSFSLPFEIGKGSREEGNAERLGSIGISRLVRGDIDLRRIRIPFTFLQGVYRVPEGPLEIPLLGGTFELRGLEVAPLSREKPLQAAFAVRDLDLVEAARALGVLEVPGRLHLDVRSLSLGGDWDRLDLDGALRLQVFGGAVELGGLSVDHPFTPYRSFSLSAGRIRDIDIGGVGRQFRFGLASGVLEGQVKDLLILGTEIAGFEAEVETVPRSGVPQYLNKAAIESIQRIFSGPFGTFEAAFFNKFRYGGFGFTCGLRNGEFRLRGKYSFGGTEYLMYSRWYQFPKIEIINTSPGLAYDWNIIVDRLWSIYHGSE